MVTEDTFLQVFGTVLAGVLIFLTVERRFGEKEAFDSYAANEKEKRDANTKLSALEKRNGQLDRLGSRYMAAGRLLPEDKRDELDEVHKEITETRNLLKTLEEESKTLSKDYKKKYTQYTNLNSIEGIITLLTIVFLSGAILILTSVPATSTLIRAEIIQNRILISSTIFSIGVILLIIRVYLHGRDI